MKGQSFRRLLFIFWLSVCTISGVAESATPTVDEIQWEDIVKLLEIQDIPLTWHDSEGNSIAYYHLRFGAEDNSVRIIEQAHAKRKYLPQADRLAYFAAQGGLTKALGALLKSGISPNLSVGGDSLLMTAARAGRLEAMRQLIAAGADVRYTYISKYRKNGFDDAMTSALRAGQYFAARLLVDSGYSLYDRAKNDPNAEILFNTINGGSADSLKYISKYVNLSVTSSNGETPLTYAIKNRVSIEMLRELLLQGANSCAANAQNKTPLAMVETLSEEDQFSTRYIEVVQQFCK
jgi:ankyrin repeat protein